MRKEESEYGGIKFDKYISDIPSTAVACIDNERLILKGIPKISICKNQMKFGDELEISLIAHKDKGYVKQSRNNSPWNVIEIYIPLSEAKEIIKQLNTKLKEVENGNGN